MKQSKTVLCALLLLAGGLSRLPFAGPAPINWDAVQFALGVERFDLHMHQPHAPGYILYLLMGRAVNLLVGDPSLALSLLSALASAFAVPLVYLSALDIFDDVGVALGAALLVLGSPLALYYGAVGLTYAPEMAMSVAVGWAAWRARQRPTVRSAVVMGVLLGLAGVCGRRVWLCCCRSVCGRCGDATLCRVRVWRFLALRWWVSHCSGLRL